MSLEDGFVWQFTTPVRQYSTPSGWSYSWGHITWTWIYATTYEAACVDALKWFEAMDAKWKAKAA